MKWYNDLSEKHKTMLWWGAIGLFALWMLYWTLSPYFWGKYNGYKEGRASCPQINVSVFLAEGMRKQIVEVGKINIRKQFEASIESVKATEELAYSGYQLETLVDGFVEGWGEGFGECFGL